MKGISVQGCLSRGSLSREGGLSRGGVLCSGRGLYPREGVSVWGFCPQGVFVQEVSVWVYRGFVQGGILGSLSRRGVSVQGRGSLEDGSLFRVGGFYPWEEVSIQGRSLSRGGGLCPGEGFLSREGSLPGKGVSVQEEGVSFQVRGLCSGEGVSIQGERVSVHQVSVQGRGSLFRGLCSGEGVSIQGREGFCSSSLCPGGLCSGERGLCPGGRGLCPGKGVSVQDRGSLFRESLFKGRALCLRDRFLSRQRGSLFIGSLSRREVSVQGEGVSVQERGSLFRVGGLCSGSLCSRGRLSV